MQISPYLFFNGDARAAATRYAEVFGVVVPEFMTMADAPPGMDIPQERMDWVMHCSLDLGGQTIMLSDDFAANSPPMDGTSVMVNMDTAAQARKIFDALADGGEVRMPFEPSFWSAGFGTLTDAFGIRWMVGTTQEPG